MTPSAGPGRATGQVDYVAIENSPPFRRLRLTQRAFVIPAVSFGLIWYIIYVLMASWATDFMSTKVIGNVNWAIILGLAQILTTFAITLIYVAFANRKLDPEAAAIRCQVELELTQLGRPLPGQLAGGGQVAGGGQAAPADQSAGSCPIVRPDQPETTPGGAA
ncbi:MAG: DUF485 domain-containing protein [Bifidobacteriaceae bacterium]|jgi:uncharacterized membrane protein (DUF485 family)|nr:DUF485 domain-containing protein [Bifidobacteriaceae bacterium]